MKAENTAKKLIPLIDLTILDDQDTPQTIEKLYHKVKTPYGFVAAVCIYPQFVKLAYKLLMKTPVKVATVANFPNGNQLITDCIENIKQSIADGADEIDVVMPYTTYLEGNTDSVKEFLQVCCGICAPHTVLKVIIETGALINHDVIFSATNLAIQTGADFIKTSTGKITTGATPEAVELILEAIKNYPEKKLV
ncbi:deoxyribose-phosphate aldolase [Coxiella-like endosymbiont]|uniref:deoxyribose-phosphate aldolase n=1 Tax=Coxiella-like endosymbiont TaxID=1592897 RepID=UPI00272A0607|nr:deoxyribose-phosphate aldolase [Coxiella-like endosymbiont]